MAELSEDFIYELFRWFRLFKVGRIYPLKVYKGNRVIINIVPCCRKADGTKGIYDMVGKKFYTIDYLLKLLDDSEEKGNGVKIILEPTEKKISDEENGK